MKANRQIPEVSSKRFVSSVINKWEDSLNDWRQGIIEFSYNPDNRLHLVAGYDDFNENNVLEPEERKEGSEWSSEFVYESKTVKLHGREICENDNLIQKEKPLAEGPYLCQHRVV